MPEDRVIDEIKKAINEREKTDRILSFGGYFLTLLILSIIAVLGYASENPGILLLGLIPITFRKKRRKIPFYDNKANWCFLYTR